MPSARRCAPSALRTTTGHLMCPAAAFPAAGALFCHVSRDRTDKEDRKSHVRLYDMLPGLVRTATF